MKKLFLIAFVVVLLASCTSVTPEPTPTLEPTATVLPTVEPTEEPTPEPTVVPEPTPYPEQWRRALIEDTHSFYQKTGKYNDAGNPFFENAHVGKAYEGEVYWCDWPIQGDGEKYCKVVIGEFEGYFLRVRKISWLDRE